MQERLELLLHPLRMRILTELIAHERTPSQVAAALPDVPHATLYRQIKLLLDGGLLEIASEKPVNGALERTYRVKHGAGRLTLEEMRSLSAEDHQQAFLAYMVSLLETFTQYTQKADLSQVGDDGMSYRRITLQLSDDEFQTLTYEFETLLASYLNRPPSPESKRYVLGAITIPQGDSS